MVRLKHWRVKPGSFEAQSILNEVCTYSAALTYSFKHVIIHYHSEFWNLVFMSLVTSPCSYAHRESKLNVNLKNSSKRTFFLLCHSPQKHHGRHFILNNIHLWICNCFEFFLFFSLPPFWQISRHSYRCYMKFLKILFKKKALFLL